MKIAIDQRRCEGYGFCEERAGDLLELTDDGDLSLLADPVPETRAEAARAAVRSCPVSALRLLDTE